MTYDEALEYIHGVNWTFCKPGLDRIRHLCHELGNPQDSLRFVHVAGTNGKGSFSSMLASILTECGLKTGLYTSPYILDFCERMQINGRTIPHDTLASITERVKPIADAMTDKPTEFELICAIAFLYFKQEKVDVVVLECGMGGRLDSTNIINTSLLSVITGISLDHTAFLGDTVEKIAHEKAGIIKPHTPVLFGGESPVALAVIENTAVSLGSALYRADYNALKIHSMTPRGADFDYKTHTGVHIRLAGLYQPRNTALVLEAVDILKKAIPEITEDSILRGLCKARWPARFEIIHEDPIVIFDGAHNPEGIDAAVTSIEHYFKDKVVAVSGVLKDKDYRAIAKRLSDVCSDIYTITPDSPRALPCREYAKVLEENRVRATGTKSVGEALRLGIDLAKKRGTPLVCLGSLYTYGEVISALKNADTAKPEGK